MARDGTRRPLQGCRVLVVEDEFFIADDLAVALAARGAEVVGPAPTGEAALAFLDGGGRIDLAVLDINLQGRLVFPVADLLAARAIPFLFATGYTAASVPARFQGVPRWEKPFDPAALADSLPALAAGGWDTVE